MRVAFYLENGAIPDVDLSRPSLGNPGCGGAQYMLAAISSYLAEEEEKTGCQILLLANHVHRLPGNVTSLRVSDVVEAASKAKAEGCDIFVYRPRRHIEAELLAQVDRLSLPTIARFSITPTGPYLQALANSANVKAVVCVGREQHDLAWDTPVWPKLTHITNGFDVDGFRLKNPPAKESGLVVYLGALVPQKGFHLLARAWPRVLRRHPKARLAVIGSGALYGEEALGPWGVAAPDYEAQFAPPLAGPDRKPHPSVSFLGKLGLEKKEWLHRAIVGVPNPSGQTENCPGSAVEFQACGTAVVSAARYGLLDTVRDRETGLLGRGENDLVNNICALLEDPDRAETLGKNGVRFVRGAFDIPAINANWHDLIDRLVRGDRPRTFFLKRNLHQHSKGLILLNRFLQMTLGRLIPWPSTIEVKSCLAKLPAIRTIISLRTR